MLLLFINVEFFSEYRDIKWGKKARIRRRGVGTWGGEKQVRAKRGCRLSYAIANYRQFDPVITQFKVIGPRWHDLTWLKIFSYFYIHIYILYVQQSSVCVCCYLTCLLALASPRRLTLRWPINSRSTICQSFYSPFSTYIQSLQFINLFYNFKKKTYHRL